MMFQNREEQVREEIVIDEAIRRIENYGGQYDPDSSMDAWDQLLVCEAVAEATPVRDNYYQNKKENQGNEKSPAYEDVFDSYKRTVNFELTESKLKVITRLESCNYRTSPIKVAELLEEFFREWPSFEGYWLSVAQQHPPRPIIRVIKRIVKQQTSGFTTVKNPAKLFSFLIKNRAFRKHRL